MIEVKNVRASEFVKDFKTILRRFATVWVEIPGEYDRPFAFCMIAYAFSMEKKVAI